jgi:hypothetical protein
MANRSYLYSLSNQPTSYADRPETISGLSEWAYCVPFSYRLLMSGVPKLCSSLISDGFEDEPQNKKTRLYAISSEFEMGFRRLKRFFSILRPFAASGSRDLNAGLTSWRKFFSFLRPRKVDGSPDLAVLLDETVAFLEAHRNRYLLLETIELDSMSAEGEAALQSCVEKEIKACIDAGNAMDALPEDLGEAGKCLAKATREKCGPPLDAFFGLRLDGECDNIRNDMTQYPMGLEWSDVL